MQRCAQGLRSKPTLIKNDAAKRVKQEAEGFMSNSLDLCILPIYMNMEVMTGRMATGNVVGPRSRSRSPPRKLQVSNIGMDKDVTIDQYVEKRNVKMFYGLVQSYRVATGGRQRLAQGAA